MPHPIELELRGELTSPQKDRVREALLKQGFAKKNETHRTMLMSFGIVGRIAEDTDIAAPQETDIRCRITNGQAEIVVKLGGVHAHDRREISTPVSPETLAQFARVIGSLNMLHKVGSRFTENFVRDDITASIVSSKSGLAYLELEKMSDELHLKKDQQELNELAKTLDIPLWPDREAFIEFCTRLTNQDDWRFYGTEEDVRKFLLEIKRS
ncbi:hypothetical protein KBD61_03490 [Patescibacteria group bacterium]|nr:hypothetical protein [Patescibacteria group bacterium]MBP9710060.1 hypothetical protein [Patescibacteria group bacterium]